MRKELGTCEWFEDGGVFSWLVLLLKKKEMEIGVVVARERGVGVIVRDRGVIKSIIFKLGFALTLSFAGYLFSRIRIRNTHPPKPPDSGKSGVDERGRTDGGTGLKEELRVLQSCSTPDASSTKENEEAALTVETADVGFSPSSKNSGNEEGLLLPEFNDLVSQAVDVSGDSFCLGISQTKDGTEITLIRKTEEEMGTEQEINRLRNMVRILGERERNLEIQLLELYGMKEQESAVRELQNRLKINSVESKLFMLKIESLQAENKRLEAQLSDYSIVTSELETARAKIKLLKRKIRSDNEQTKEQLSALRQRVSILQEQEREKVSMNDAEIQNTLLSLKALEEDSIKLREENMRLQCNNSELVIKLESTQMLASSALQDLEEAKAMEKVAEEANQLRQANEDLSKELDRLQTDRCADVEELVYLRWVNACLRYELRNYQAPPGKTVAKNLSNHLSPKSEEKAKQLILEYATGSGRFDEKSGLADLDSEYYSSSSQSTTTEITCGFDDSSIDVPSNTRHDDSSSKRKFFSKLKKLVTGKDKSHIDRSLERTPNTSRRRGSMGSIDDIMGTTYSCDSASSSSCVTVEHASSSTHLSSTKLFHDRTSSVEGDPKKVARSQSMLTSSSVEEVQRRKKLSLDEIREQRHIGGRGFSFSMEQEGSRNRILGVEDGVATGLLCDDPHLLYHGGPTAPEEMELLKFARVLKNSSGRQSTFNSY